MKVIAEIKRDHVAIPEPIRLHTENVTTYFYFHVNCGNLWFRPIIYCEEQDTVLSDIYKNSEIYGKITDDGYITFVYPPDYLDHEKLCLTFILMMLTVEPSVLKMYRPYDYSLHKRLFKFIEYPKILEDIRNGRLDMSILVYFLDTLRYF